MVRGQYEGYNVLVLKLENQLKGTLNIVYNNYINIK